MTTIIGTPGDDTSLTGSAGADTIDGMGGNDIMFGFGGDDVFDGDIGTLVTGGAGSAGIDQMIGGDGNDTYFVDNTSDAVVELNNGGSGTDLVISTVNYALSANVENLTLDLAGSATVGTGNVLVNIITGNNNGDTLDGGGNADTMMGGTGNDTYIVDNSGDVVNEPDAPPAPPTPDTEIDLIKSSVAWDLGTTPFVENLTLTGNANVNAIGNGLDNVLIGNAGNNTIDASSGGNDTLDGGTGVDKLIGGAGNDTFFVDNKLDVVVANASGVNTTESTVTWTMGVNEQTLFLLGNANINGTTSAAGGTIHGNSGANILTGLGGNDILDGGAGGDIMNGGAGNDLYFVDNVNDKVFETLAGGAGGVDTVVSSINYTLSNNVENLNLSGTGNVNGTGNAADNVIVGNSGNNTLDGGGSVLGDTLHGGDGNDTYIVRGVNDVVDEIAAQGIDTVLVGFTYSLQISAPNVENLTLTGVGNFNGTGNDVNNVITGNAGANVLDGGLGADTMIGGAGNDTYMVDNAGDVVTESVNGGTADLVIATDSFTLGANVENLNLLGSLDMVGTGNNLSNIINALGASGNETLDGGAGGVDSLVGGTGNNFYIVHTGNEHITLGGATNTLESADISLNLTTPQFSVFNIATLLGSANLNLTGGAGNDTLTGNDGNNIIDGGGGIDTLEGGLGNDTFIVNTLTDVISDIGGVDTISSSINYDLSTVTGIENLVLTGAAVTGTGDAFDNSITGNALANILNGGLGADTMAGGAGNDTYVVDNVGDVVIEQALGGTADLVQATASYTLGANVERLQLSGATDMVGTGNGLSNVIDASGASGNETLDGGIGGTDTLIGGTGNNFYIVHSGTEIITTGGASNTLESSNLSLNLGSGNFSTFHVATLLGSSNLSLTGGGGNDTLTGNDGNNTINGGFGNDTLEGGLGNDTFIVDTTTDVITDMGGIDTVASSVTFDLSTTLGVENLILTGAAAINGTGDSNDNVLTGNAAVNTLTGGAGNDTLDGKAGADTMVGGLGDDTFFVDNANDVIKESLGEGNDTVIVAAGIHYVLPANVEIMVQLGGSSSTLTGGAGDDTLKGTTGNDTLNGGAGADTMIGGKGHDSYLVDNAGDVIIEQPGEGTDKVIITSDPLNGFNSFDLSVSAVNVENATVIGNTDFSLTGNAGDNILVTGSGNDVLDGGTGADLMIGGLGNDVYVISSTGDRIIDTGGNDTVLSPLHYTLQNGLENLILFNPPSNETDFFGKGNGANNILDGSSLTHDYTLLGLGGNDTLLGGAGNDSLDGGVGADTMSGGAGNDTYFVDNIADVINESTGGGTDLLNVGPSAHVYVLNPAAEVENISLLGGTGQSFTGSDTDNIITTNGFSKYIFGMGGNDTITGSATTDVIDGGIGDDIITGNGGHDRLTGGAGQDTFVFKFATAFTTVVDIMDFSATDTGSIGATTPLGDVLDFSDIVTHFTGIGHLEPMQDWIRIVDSGSDSIVQIDLDGAATAHHYQTVAILHNVNGLTDEVGLLLSGNINAGSFFS